jgi:hypothetical protein
MTTLTPPTSIPCPDWCDKDPGHGYEWTTEQGLDGRNHNHKFGTDAMEATVVSEALYTEGGELLNAGPWLRCGSTAAQSSCSAGMPSRAPVA